MWPKVHIRRDDETAERHAPAPVAERVVSVAFVLVGVSIALAAAMLIEPLARRARLPLGALLVVAGFGFSEAVIALGIDTGVRWQAFHDMTIYLVVPILVFEAALHMNVPLLRRYLAPVMVLAVPVLLLGVAICAAILFVGMGHPSGFPWQAAAIASALLAATDPTAALEILRRSGASERLIMLIDGEGLFSDAIAIVLFMTLIGAALAADSAGAEWTTASLGFAWNFSAGLALGGALGFVCTRIMRAVGTPVHRGMVTLVFVFGAYLCAENLLNASGVMAVLVLGLITGRGYRRNMLEEDRDFVTRLWQFNGYIAYAVVFFLVGFTVTTDMFKDRWLAMLLAIAAVLVARLPGVWLALPLTLRVTGSAALGGRGLGAVYFGGVRGAVTLALALALPIELEYWYTIQSMAYGVVLFTLFVQAPLAGLLARGVAAPAGQTGRAGEN